VDAEKQLAALAAVDSLFTRADIEYWLFGGWAVDFHAGEVTRAHDDLDIAVWAADLARAGALLQEDGWRHVPAEVDDGYTTFERRGVRLEVALLARDESGDVFTPLESGGRGEWPPATFGDDVRELHSVRVRVVGLRALKADKAEKRSDSGVAAKDSADLTALTRLGL
jgi:hypothetical protein